MPKTSTESRAWIAEAIRRVDADANRSADTHLHVAADPGPGHRPLPQGRVGPPDRQPQAPPRPVAVPVRPVQRLAQARDDRHRGVERVDGGQRGLLRAARRAAVRRGHAGHDQPREDRPDRVLRRSVPSRRRPRHGLRRRRAARERVRRALHGPVHVRRAGHGLARQQQHRRVDLRAARRRAAPVPEPDRRRRRHRRHVGDDRPLRPLSPARHPGRGRRPRELRVLRRLGGRPRPTSPPTRRPASRASAACGSRSRSSAASSTTWSTFRTRLRSPRCAGSRTSSAGAWADRPAPTSGRRSS